MVMNGENYMQKLKLITSKIAVFLSSIWIKLKAAIVKIKKLVSQVVTKVSSNRHINAFFQSRITKMVAMGIVIIIALSQVVFGVMVYKYHSENKVTRVAAKVLPFPVGVVNQHIISYDQYLHEKDYIHHFYQATQQEDFDFSEIDKQILDQLIQNKIIAIQAKNNNISVSQEEVDLTMADIINQNGGEEKVNKVLNDLYGLNLDEFRNLVKTQLLRDKLDNKMIAKVKVKHILVRVDQNAPEDKVNEAKTKIEGYLNEINGGLDFAEAAKKYSEDVGSAELGGDLEPFAAGEMVKEFSEAAFKTPVGQISNPIKSEFGWHIIKVEDKSGKIEKSFGDWLSEIVDKSLIIRFI